MIIKTQETVYEVLSPEGQSFAVLDVLTGTSFILSGERLPQYQDTRAGRYHYLEACLEAPLAVSLDSLTRCKYCRGQLGVVSYLQSRLALCLQCFSLKQALYDAPPPSQPDVDDKEDEDSTACSCGKQTEGNCVYCEHSYCLDCLNYCEICTEVICTPCEESGDHCCCPDCHKCECHCNYKICDCQNCDGSQYYDHYCDECLGSA